ncbi:hypothetical protein JIX56_06895 [Streptomyces sp. CA-210063]|uniref:hypothetical protein n=1 Tax=Streptomyces sp. CA-210063 TaxID=2801029 RepID=UPI00214AB5DA|nr:hypothetical protein [Streptomyces sp. CA-210063]UUU29633.1 hypothetical protein JIX56_06895 [Streptomyces sp. CA-210063]
MRRIARVLSATALTGAVLGAAAPAAYADSAAEASPQTADPGGTLTISVACDPTDGPAPESIDASSQAFEQGTVTLQRLPGDDDSAAGPSYEGTATIAPAADLEIDPDASDSPSEWGVDGTCPTAPGGEAEQWSAAFDVSHGDKEQDPAHEPMQQPTHESDHQPTHGSDHQATHESDHQPAHEPDHQATHQPTHHSTHHPAPVQRGVHAGGGGAFTDSVPALVAGGLLVAGALGAAVHRLHRRSRWTP